MFIARANSRCVPADAHAVCPACTMHFIARNSNAPVMVHFNPADRTGGVRFSGQKENR
jgi:hypothetical protein